jgi:hypothetical protein
LHVSQYPLGIKTRVSYTGWDKKQLCVTYNRSLKDLSSGVEIKLDSASINSYSAASMTAIFPLLGGGGCFIIRKQGNGHHTIVNARQYGS